MNYRMMTQTNATRTMAPDSIGGVTAGAVVETKVEPVVEAKVEPIVEAKVDETKDEAALDLKTKEPTLLAEKTEDKTDEAKVEAVVVPEAYELKAPDGVELDAAMVELATPIFKELGLGNEQAQKIVSLYAEHALPAVAKQVQDETLRLLGMSDIGQWTAQVKADAEIGGAKFEETLAAAAVGRGLASPGLRDVLETSRLGNHPEMVRFFAKVGKTIGEGAVHAGGQVGLPTTSLYDPAFSPKA